MAQIGIDARLWNQTGIGRYIRNLVVHLIEIDPKNQYVLFARPEDILDIKSAVNSQRLVIIPTGIKWHSAREQIEFPNLLNAYKLDLVHFPYFSFPVFYKRPFVVTVHDLIINHFPTGKATTLPRPLYALKRLGYKFISKKAVHDAKKVIVPSNATRAEILDHYKIRENKIVVTPEGVDEGISTFTPILFKEKNPYFLYVGNAYPHKNLERLVEAFKVFSIQYPVFTLKLVGKEDFFYKRLKEQVKRERIENIEFLGYLDDSELSKMYSGAEATFVPSLMEGFGLTVLEAMKMGSLVAASKIPSIEEVAGTHAFYFQPEDTISIVNIMKEIVYLPEKEKKEKIVAAQRHCEKYSWKKTAELTLAVFNSCL